MKKRIWGPLFISIVIFSCSVFADVKLKPWSFPKGNRHGLYNNLGSLKNLESKVFDKSVSFDEKWKHINTLSKAYSRQEAKTFLLKCLNHKAWYMQSAALKNMVFVDKDLALKKALYFMGRAESLVVRSAAVKVVGELGGKSNIEALYAELYNRKNFRKSQSLWIRPQIAQTLIKLDRGVQTVKWSKLTDDLDLKIKRIALKQLEKTF